MSDEQDPSGEFTRFKAKVQLGDGPDARGEVTVETVREVRQDADRGLREVTLPDGSTLEAPANHAEFAEWYAEMERAVMVLRDSLGLKDDHE